MPLRCFSLAGGALLAAVTLHAQSFSTLFTFESSSQAFPNALLLAPDGTVYGASMGGGDASAVFSLLPPSKARPSWDLQILATLSASQGTAVRNLAISSGGLLYGAAFFGGNAAAACAASGCGTLFSLAPPASPGAPWTDSTLHAFAGVDGAYPVAVLYRGNPRSLFGITEQGGTSTACTFGCGTLVRLTQLEGIWSERVIHSFTGGSDGAYPVGPLVVLDDKFYGVTNQGGGASLPNCEFGCGTVYELATGRGWVENVVYSFAGGANGAHPSNLIQGPPGALYGVTQTGGLFSPACPEGCGTVFSLTRSKTSQAWTQTVIHRFTGDGGGINPQGLVLGAGGQLYGFTVTGGLAGQACGNAGCGTLFELAPPSAPDGSWTASVLHRFTGESDGWYPSSLILDSSANALLGTAQYGGAGKGCTYTTGSYGCGVIFELSF